MHGNLQSWFESSVWGEKRADAQAQCAQAGIEIKAIYDELSPD